MSDPPHWTHYSSPWTPISRAGEILYFQQQKMKPNQYDFIYVNNNSGIQLAKTLFSRRSTQL